MREGKTFTEYEVKQLMPAPGWRVIELAQFDGESEMECQDVPVVGWAVCDRICRNLTTDEILSTEPAVELVVFENGRVQVLENSELSGCSNSVYEIVPPGAEVPIERLRERLKSKLLATKAKRGLQVALRRGVAN